jgi:hypothetical protein
MPWPRMSKRVNELAPLQVRLYAAQELRRTPRLRRVVRLRRGPTRREADSWAVGNGSSA